MEKDKKFGASRMLSSSAAWRTSRLSLSQDRNDPQASLSFRPYRKARRTIGPGHREEPQNPRIARRLVRSHVAFKPATDRIKMERLLSVVLEQKKEKSGVFSSNACMWCTYTPLKRPLHLPSRHNPGHLQPSWTLWTAPGTTDGSSFKPPSGGGWRFPPPPRSRISLVRRRKKRVVLAVAARKAFHPNLLLLLPVPVACLVSLCPLKKRRLRRALPVHLRRSCEQRDLPGCDLRSGV